MFHIFKKVASARTNGRGPQAVKQGPSFPPDFDEWTIELLKRVKPFTMTSYERVFSLCKAVEYLVTNSIEGSIVECGVWKGGSMMAAASVLLRLGVCDRELCLFDTFEGMPTPGRDDVSFRGVSASDLMERAADNPAAWIWARSNQDEVKQNLLSTGYPKNRINLVKGRVEETVPAFAPGHIALLRLDTDWYESTRHEMEHLFPRLAVGGVLIVDDYGHWKGARKAVDEYVATHNVPLLLNRIDYTGRIAVKVDG